MYIYTVCAEAQAKDGCVPISRSCRLCEKNGPSSIYYYLERDNAGQGVASYFYLMLIGNDNCTYYFTHAQDITAQQNIVPSRLIIIIIMPKTAGTIYCSSSSY